jgi:hypothetical protein
VPTFQSLPGALQQIVVGLVACEPAWTAVKVPVGPSLPIEAVVVKWTSAEAGFTTGLPLSGGIVPGISGCMMPLRSTRKHALALRDSTRAPLRGTLAVLTEDLYRRQGKSR